MNPAMIVDLPVIMVHSSSIFLFFLDHPICPSINIHKQSFPIFDFSLKQTICLWFPTFFLLIVSDTKVILTTLSIYTDGFISAADFFLCFYMDCLQNWLALHHKHAHQGKLHFPPFNPGCGVFFKCLIHLVVSIWVAARYPISWCLRKRVCVSSYRLIQEMSSSVKLSHTNQQPFGRTELFFFGDGSQPRSD